MNLMEIFVFWNLLTECGKQGFVDPRAGHWPLMQRSAVRVKELPVLCFPCMEKVLRATIHFSLYYNFSDS